MATLLWGQVYHKDQFAGVLREEPGERTSFTYDSGYLEAGHPAIAHTLPLRSEPHISPAGLHPFFDNLVAEGWLEQAQTRLLKKRIARRFELLLAFGQDCAGAVSVIDPTPSPISAALMDMDDPKQAAVFRGRASLSGIQPKLAAVERNGKLHPARTGELSTHIVKFPTQTHDDLVVNEYLATEAFKALLPQDVVVELEIGTVEGFSEPALLIRRFDRGPGGERLHFEEFNQLLGQPSAGKYDGAYKDMADFIAETPGCLPAENYRLYLRILAGLLIGNTDMHLKNFAMFHTEAGLRLTPSYDMVSAVMYDYKNVALALGGTSDLILGSLKPGSISRLGEEFRLGKAALNMAFNQLAKNRAAAKDAVAQARFGTAFMKDKIIEHMEKRWNGTFASIGKKS